MEDPNIPVQYTPLTPQQILTYFNEVKERILALEMDFQRIVSLNKLVVKEPIKRQEKPKMARRKAAEHTEEDAMEDVKIAKAAVNKGLAKHTAKEHPGRKAVTIKRGGKPASRAKGRGR